ncbi:MAG: IS1182 family transposase [Desulfuromusa sp.]|nr:IS1182 family transposase [Desulfuromusa sp.]
MSISWSRPKQSREQILLFSPSLDDVIPKDHAIRQLDAVLSAVDWSDWEMRYNLLRGQPPIHPRLIAGIILYGLHCHLRSSRDLEDGTRNRIDFMWFLDNMTIDHSTFATFRKKFEKELKGLNRQIIAVALKLSMSQLSELSVDGTRIKAYSSRDKARKAKYLEKLLAELDLELEKALAITSQQDIEDQPDKCTAVELEKELKRLQTKREKIEYALQTAKSRDAVRVAKQGKSAKPVSVPVNDPEAYLQPNKEGGHAPNYTPTAAVDKTSGCIISADVVEGNAESDAVMPAVQEAEQGYGHKPQKVCTDGNLACGQDQAEFAKQNITFYAPTASVPAELSPAARPDPRQPLPEEQWKELPMRGKKRKQLARGAFLYDQDANCYWCPLGKALTPSKTGKKKTNKGTIAQTIYTCSNCSDCPLMEQCLSGSAKRRNITRDEYEELREATAKRMQSEEGKEIYKSRAPTVETVFGHIKRVMGIRQFSTIGLKNVQNEWQWICTSFNLMKLLRMIAKATKPLAS